MTFRKNGGYYQLRLFPGEEVVATLVEFCRKQRVRSGVISGIGAAEDVVLGCFDRKRRMCHKRAFRGDCEIAALVGNTAWAGREPICHIHAVISTPKLAAHAGHLFSATVTVTCEVAITPGSVRLSRTPDPASGLKLLALGRGAGS
jgi:predicted DNA-binding protein with PD1-like motif